MRAEIGDLGRDCWSVRFGRHERRRRPRRSCSVSGSRHISPEIISLCSGHQGRQRHTSEAGRADRGLEHNPLASIPTDKSEEANRAGVRHPTLGDLRALWLERRGGVGAREVASEVRWNFSQAEAPAFWAGRRRLHGQVESGGRGIGGRSRRGAAGDRQRSAGAWRSNPGKCGKAWGDWRLQGQFLRHRQQNRHAQRRSGSNSADDAIGWRSGDIRLP